VGALAAIERVREDVHRQVGVGVPTWLCTNGTSKFVARSMTEKATTLPCVQEGEHGEHAAVIVAGFGEAQLAEDAADVLLDCAFGHP
jgi:hypothetical protein